MNSRAPQLKIALPALAMEAAARAFDGGPRLPGLEWLLARGRRDPAVRPWREWLLEDACLGEDALLRFPAGPCAHASWSGQAPAGTWACAAPVHLLTAIDHLALAAPAPLPLAVDESAALLADINRQLAGSGFQLHAFTDRGWLCECPPALDCIAAEPREAVGRNLRGELPSGPDAVRLRAIVNELQMLLHEHPVNERRASLGLPVVNSVWLWGFGAAGSRRSSPSAELLTDDDWLAGLWRLHGATARSPTGLPGLLRTPQDPAVPLLVGLSAGTGASDDPGRWSALDRELMEPARAALRSGAVRRVSLHTGEETYDLEPDARWRFWRTSRPLGELFR